MLVVLPSGKSNTKRQHRNVKKSPVNPDIERTHQAIIDGSASDESSSYEILEVRREAKQRKKNSEAEKVFGTRLHRRERRRGKNTRIS